MIFTTPMIVTGAATISLALKTYCPAVSVRALDHTTLRPCVGDTDCANAGGETPASSNDANSMGRAKAEMHMLF